MSSWKSSGRSDAFATDAMSRALEGSVKPATCAKEAGKHGGETLWAPGFSIADTPPIQPTTSHLYGEAFDTAAHCEDALSASPPRRKLKRHAHG